MSCSIKMCAHTITHIRAINFFMGGYLPADLCIGVYSNSTFNSSLPIFIFNVYFCILSINLCTRIIRCTTIFAIRFSLCFVFGHFISFFSARSISSETSDMALSRLNITRLLRIAAWSP